MSVSHSPRTEQEPRALLRRIAQRAMLERGLFPTFSEAVSAEVQRIRAPATAKAAPGTEPSPIRDLTSLDLPAADGR